MSSTAVPDRTVSLLTAGDGQPNQPAHPATPMTGGAPGQSPGITVTSQPATVPEPAAGGVPVPVVGGLLVAALVAGAVLGWLIRTASRSTEEDRRPPPATTGQGRDTELLAAALIDLGDRITNPALADRARNAVRSAGWTVVDPQGQPFDPDRHHAVDRQVTGDQRLDRVVAATERPGWIDPAGTVVRYPDVIVYRYEPVAVGGTP